MPGPIHKEILNWSAFLQMQSQLCKDTRLKKFYDQGTYPNDTKLKDIEFVALDFETTGLDARQNSIISIGLIPFNLQRIFCNRAKKWYIKPEDKLQEESIIIHGITHSDLQGAPDLLGVLAPLLDELAGKVVVVHYRNIERDFLDRNLRSMIKEGVVFPLIDTMQIEANIQRQQSAGLLNWWKKKKPKSIRLGNTRWRYNLPSYQPHDALTDAIATAELFQAQVSYHYDPEMPIQELWL
ncbi:3'-5' exonuclease [Psychromonas aquatilis]|uniref:3'-5' exonuclease n=1 Tax=Psychromonas aquatilis TaxID=2005072 RepID=A0ABU9GNJ7_9GAMM